MRLSTIDIGTGPNDGTGDPLRTAFEKLNLAIGKLNVLPLTEAEWTIADALATIAKEYAYRREMRGPDGSLQFEVPYTPQSRSRIMASGGYWNPSIWVESTITQSGVLIPVDLAVTAWQGGRVVFGNILGIHGIIGGERADGQITENYIKLLGGRLGGAAVITADGSRPDVSIAIVPPGTGAITRTEPDGFSTGGNVRGVFANDFQSTRSTALRVANGGYSVIGGGIDNYTGYLAYCAAILGGQFNTLEGQHSWCPGGILFNDYFRLMTGGWGWGTISGNSHAQAAEGGLKGLATSATPVRMTTDGDVAAGDNIFNLPNNSLYRIRMLCAAQQIGGGSGSPGTCATAQIDFAIKRGADAAATVIVGTPVISYMSDAAASTWTFAVAADATNGGVALTFTGQADKTVLLGGRISSLELIQ